MAEPQKADVTSLPVDRDTRRQELSAINFNPAGQMFRPQNGRELMDMANLMAGAGFMVKDIYRNNAGACMGLISTMAPYGINPIQASWKTYQTKADAPIAYEAQLIVAMLNASGAVRGGLRYRFKGDGQNRVCFAYGTLVGEKEPLEVESPPLSQIQPKNSPLWKTDPDQQLCYYTGRAWARRYKPEMLLGVYDVDELDPVRIGPDNARDITPRPPVRGGATYDEPVRSAPPVETADDAPAVDGEIVAEDPKAALIRDGEEHAERGEKAFVDWYRARSNAEKDVLAGPVYSRLKAAAKAAEARHAAGEADTDAPTDPSAFIAVAESIRGRIVDQIARSDIEGMFEAELAAMATAAPELFATVSAELAAAPD